MSDVRPVEEGSIPARCPWCSAQLASTSEPKCPSCGATLAADTEPQLPGVTTVAPQSIARTAERRRPNRLVQWITGETADAGAQAAPAAPGSLTPPSGDVRVEMLRLEIAAQLAQRSAEVDALEAEARLEAATPANGSSAESATQAASLTDEADAEMHRAQTWAELEDRETPTAPSAGPAPAPAADSDTTSVPSGQNSVSAPTEPARDGSTDSVGHSG